MLCSSSLVLLLFRCENFYLCELERQSFFPKQTDLDMTIIYNQIQKYILNMDRKVENILIEDHQQKGHLENEGSSYSRSEEEFQNVLNEIGESKEQMILRFKVTELQKICQSLSETNRKLLEKLQIAQGERQKLEKNEVSIDEYTKYSGDIVEIETLLGEYRIDLNEFRDSLLKKLQEKKSQINEFQIEITNLKGKNEQLRKQREELEKLNKKLQSRNQGLILEVEHLQRQKNKFEENSNRNHRYIKTESSIYGEDYQSEFNSQLEGIINKLVKQLEYEKGVKRKMNEEIKRLSKELMSYEKQIMDKNKKIYDLELSIIRNSKGKTQQAMNIVHHQNGTDRSRNKQNNHKMFFKNFNLLQLVNRELDLELSTKEKKIIGTKIIQLYERKLDRRDYNSLSAENISVCNFSQASPQLTCVRKIGKNVLQDREKSESSLIWNLAFMVDSLFNEDQGQEQILEQTSKMLEREYSNEYEDLNVLKDLLQF